MSDKEKILKLLHSIIIRTNIVSIGRQANNPDNIDLCFKRATQEIQNLFPEFEPDNLTNFFPKKEI